MNCAPGVKKNCTKCKSCFDKNSLIKIAKAFNQTNPVKKIVIRNKSHQSIWNQLRKVLANKCKYESCWIEQDFVKKLSNKKILNETFIPKMPSEWQKNKYTWLNTLDINSVMKQYEKLYNNFSFLGPVPVDCPSGINCELSTINPIELKKKGINQLGIIFNLDYHYQPGSHWVALMIDSKNNPHSVDYFDSYGEVPHKLIKLFMNKMHNLLQQEGDTAVKIYNDKRHQFGHSECGIYSIHYLLQRLKGKTPYDFTKKIIKDDVMNQMREYLFRKV